jgi:hypothetical protein
VEQRLICGNEAEAVFCDSTHHKVHRHANGPGTAQSQLIGKSKSGLHMNPYVVVDAVARLAAVIILHLETSVITPSTPHTPQTLGSAQGGAQVTS